MNEVKRFVRSTRDDGQEAYIQKTMPIFFIFSPIVFSRFSLRFDDEYD